MAGVHYYTMYRSTTIGEALDRTLHEFKEDNQITSELVARIMLNFDKVINTTLNQRVKNRITFKAEKLRAYRFCDNVWTFVMEKIDIKDSASKQQNPIGHMKIVACDASRKT